jgi:hypothetical protein
MKRCRSSLTAELMTEQNAHPSEDPRENCWSVEDHMVFGSEKRYTQHCASLKQGYVELGGAEFLKVL